MIALEEFEAKVSERFSSYYDMTYTLHDNGIDNEEFIDFLEDNYSEHMVSVDLHASIWPLSSVLEIFNAIIC